jgi:ankyrin repeat protein
LVPYIVEFTADGRGGAYWDMHLEAVVNTPAPEIDRAEDPPSKITIIQAPGETPLPEACDAGNMEACRMLESIVRYSAAMNGDAEAQNDLGTRLLQGEGKPEDFARGLEWISKAAEQGHAGAQSSLAILLRNAARKGESEKVRDLLKSGVDVNAKNEAGYTALMFAAMLGHAGVVDSLIEAGADVNAKNKQQATALMGAVAGGDTEIVKALLRAGADVNVVSTLGDTALTMAAKSGDGAEIVEILRDAGAGVDNE